MSTERDLLERVLLNRYDIPIQIVYDINELLDQPEQEHTNYMHKTFLHNLKNKEKLGEMIINIDDQYITLLGHKVVITEIIDREAYPVVGYFIDLNNDGEPRINETEWDKNGDSAYCLDWRWGLTLDTSPSPDREVFTNTRGFLTDLKRLLKSELNRGDAIDWIDAYLDKTCDFIYDEDEIQEPINLRNMTSSCDGSRYSEEFHQIGC